MSKLTICFTLVTSRLGLGKSTLGVNVALEDLSRHLLKRGVAETGEWLQQVQPRNEAAVWRQPLSPHHPGWGRPAVPPHKQGQPQPPVPPPWGPYLSGARGVGITTQAVSAPSSPSAGVPTQPQGNPALLVLLCDLPPPPSLLWGSLWITGDQSHGTPSSTISNLCDSGRISPSF